MDEGFGYILAKMLSSAFKNHPALAIVLFALIVVAILGVFLLDTESFAEIGFLVFALLFVLAVVIRYFIRTGRQQSQGDQGAEEERRE